MKTVFITGASSGIGQATAKALAPNHRLILCGRRKERLEALAQELNTSTETHILTFEVRNKEEVFQAVASLPDAWKNIDILINNAGNAHGLSSFQEADIEDLEAMIDINVKGLIYVTKAVLPLLLQHNRGGHIVNLSSIAGKETYANGSVYCASKAAVESISKGLRIDLNTKGIKVTNVAPGAVETEFSMVRFKGDQSKANQVYKGYDPLSADDIAHAIAYAINQPDHVQLADMTIFPKAQASGTTFYRKPE
ncbi:SDR family NAD(P)-dependent oxidoreductase [Myroides sp. 1354]|uniref:SDR family NAD(P)-dependent oxidoreductase n=1 Tax=unclassified Myroides TaxID=2642485 RepID=UPI002577A03C|nr:MULTISPECIES: SDR family NAD(P)-dependent oxidoreductase [unclassified Myroides]MDM1043258.1 SDR family NAD(P)-dependent oxidoreductase [Myroides sp. R163-1]MDM1054689.1 SDR family NAD(P)-dependent oxidoreductase [Myroides sp. 1354]MDM1067986.1 SDR family NAD(P)-dependent oxidoreductase [Myroides sp. 1372]